MNQLEHLIHHHIGATAAERSRIMGAFEKKTFSRNKILLNAGEVCRHFYFVESGCLRTYYLIRQGDEKTRMVAFEGMVLSSMVSFIQQEPSFEYLATIEKTTTWCMNRTDFFELVEAIAGWKQFYLQFMEQAYILTNKKMEQRVTLTAHQRYENLLKENPQIIQRLSNKLVASYLDLTQETVSRMKKQ